jgi:hypothetical protein
MIPLSGCALVNGSSQRISISTSVPDARIVVDGRPVGKTQEGEPLVLIVKRNEDHVITAQKDGYISKYQRTETRICTLGVLDLVGACIFLIPVISFITGGAFEIQPSDVYIALDPAMVSTNIPTSAQ